MNKDHLRIIVGSPNDVKDERDMLDNVMNRINQHIASNLGYHLDLIKWEKIDILTFIQTVRKEYLIQY